MGFSKDSSHLSEADLTVCYLQEDNITMGVEHYLLKNMDYAPDLHLGVSSNLSWTSTCSKDIYSDELLSCVRVILWEII